MSEEIKCPICHEMSEIRYSENRVYQSRCQNIKCHETVTVTASSESAAEELFSKFEKGTNQPQLTIPKSIAEKTVGYFDKDRPNYFERSTIFVFSNWSSDLNGDNFDENEFDKRIQIVGAYLNPLTRDLVKVVEG